MRNRVFSILFLVVMLTGAGLTQQPIPSGTSLPPSCTAPALFILRIGAVGRLYECRSGSYQRVTPDLATVATTGAYADLSGKPTLGTAAPLNVPASGDAASGEVVKGSDTRLSDARTPATHTHAAADTISGMFNVARIPDLSGTYQPLNINLSAIGALAPSNDDVLQRKAGTWTNRTVAQFKTDLGLAAIATSGSANDLGSGTVPLARLAGITTAELSATAGITNGQLAGSIAISKLTITGTPDGTKFLRDDGSWQTASGGGTPGGSDTQLQRNNAGAFGAITGATSNGTNVTFGPGNLLATSPQITTQISDANGNPIISFNPTASATTSLRVTNAINAGGITLATFGGGTDENMFLAPKNAGKIFLSTSSATGNAALSNSAGALLVNNGALPGTVLAGTFSANATGFGLTAFGLNVGVGSSNALTFNNGSIPVTVSSTEVARFTSGLRVGPSTASLTGSFTVLPSDATTNNLVTVARLGVNSNGTGATGLGPELELSAETSTTNDRLLGSIAALTTDGTDATRTGAVVVKTVNSAGTNTERARFNFFGIQLSPVAFASLGTPANGTVTYCNDCTIASTCAGSGTGAIAKRLNGVWVCD